jgi:ABC-type transporter Mla subunit MlaD
MADINIERKSGAGNVIPWIIGLLVLALIAWWLLAGRGDDDVDDGTYVDTVTAPAATADPYGAPDTVMGATITPVPADTLGGVPDTTVP